MTAVSSIHALGPQRFWIGSLLRQINQVLDWQPAYAEGWFDSPHGSTWGHNLANAYVVQALARAGRDERRVGAMLWPRAGVVRSIPEPSGEVLPGLENDEETVTYMPQSRPIMLYALKALLARDLVPRRWYDVLTRPARLSGVSVHPDDPPIGDRGRTEPTVLLPARTQEGDLTAHRAIPNGWYSRDSYGFWVWRRRSGAEPGSVRGRDITQDMCIRGGAS